MSDVDKSLFYAAFRALRHVISIIVDQRNRDLEVTGSLLVQQCWTNVLALF